MVLRGFLTGMFLALEIQKEKHTLEVKFKQLDMYGFFFPLKNCLLVKFHIKPGLKTSLFISEKQMVAMELQIIQTKDWTNISGRTEDLPKFLANLPWSINRENLLATSLRIRQSREVSWSAGSFWSYLSLANSDLAFLSPVCIIL